MIQDSFILFSYIIQCFCYFKKFLSNLDRTIRSWKEIAFPAVNSIFGPFHKTQQELDLTLMCHIVIACPALGLHSLGQLIKH